MKLAQFAMAGIAVGVLLVLVSFAWPSLVPRDSVWSDEKATQWRKEGGKVHNLSHEIGHVDAEGNPEEMAAKSAELAAAKARYREWDAELKEAQAVRQRQAAILKWIGVGCMIAGGVTLIVVRGRPE